MTELHNTDPSWSTQTAAGRDRRAQAEVSSQKNDLEKPQIAAFAGLCGHHRLQAITCAAQAGCQLLELRWWPLPRLLLVSRQ